MKNLFLVDLNKEWKLGYGGGSNNVGGNGIIDNLYLSELESGFNLLVKEKEKKKGFKKFLFLKAINFEKSLEVLFNFVIILLPPFYTSFRRINSLDNHPTYKNILSKSYAF